MKEWTEREEQEMIDRARGGDPQANYEMSLWALQRAEEEPDEPRWNKLAAKCLVKAAQAGYGPAQERMEEILRQQREKSASDEAGDEPEAAEPVRSRASRRTASERTTEQTAPRRVRRDREETGSGLYDYDSDNADDEVRTRSRAAKSAPKRDSGSGLPRLFANWTEKQWKRMEIICIAVCVVLAIVLAVMLFTGKGSKDDGGADGLVTAENMTDATGDTSGVGTGETGTYPDEATRSEIAASSLEVKPEESDYVISPTSATVNVEQTLRLRGGPDTSYALLDEMSSGAQLNIYAEKDGWALVKYNGTWGWCSKEYLDVGAAGAADDSGAVG